jgi:hypothetical protein
MDTIGGAGAVLSIAVREAVIRELSLFVVHVCQKARMSTPP